MHAILAFIALMAASCLSYAQEDSTRVCTGPLARDARFASIAAKLPLAGISKVTFEMLANESLPTSRERKAIAEYVLARRDCNIIGEDFRTGHPPHLNALVSEFDNKIVAVLVDLYNKKVSYGAANKQLQAVNDEYRIKISAMLEQIRSERAAQQAAIQQAEKNRQAAQDRDEAARRDAQAQYEDAQRQANARQTELVRQQLLLQMLQKPLVTYRPLVPYQMQPLPPSAPVSRPRSTTTCSWVGSQWTCYSN